MGVGFIVKAKNFHRRARRERREEIKFEKQKAKWSISLYIINSWIEVSKFGVTFLILIIFSVISAVNG